VNIIKSKGINHPAVLAAIEKIPRHLFIGDTAFEERAYEDEAFPIGEGQTISQPFTVAYQTQLLEIKKGEKVLEIGTGSGYQAAVLAELGAKVFTIERHRKLYLQTKQLLDHLGYRRIKCFYGDGYKGIPAFAPYDKILVTAAASEIPSKLIEQLKTGGYMVIPLGEFVQKMMRLTKNEDGSYEKEVFDQFRFVPMLKGKAQ